MRLLVRTRTLCGTETGCDECEARRAKKKYIENN